jgi:hypothetical protein
MSADYEVTAIAQHGRNSIKHYTLQLGLEIREDKVAT